MIYEPLPGRMVLNGNWKREVLVHNPPVCLVMNYQDNFDIFSIYDQWGHKIDPTSQKAEFLKAVDLIAYRLREFVKDEIEFVGFDARGGHW